MPFAAKILVLGLISPFLKKLCCAALAAALVRASQAVLPRRWRRLATTATASAAVPARLTASAAVPAAELPRLVGCSFLTAAVACTAFLASTTCSEHRRSRCFRNGLQRTTVSRLCRRSAVSWARSRLGGGRTRLASSRPALLCGRPLLLRRQCGRCRSEPVATGDSRAAVLRCSVACCCCCCCCACAAVGRLVASWLMGFSSPCQLVLRRLLSSSIVSACFLVGTASISSVHQACDSRWWPHATREHLPRAPLRPVCCYDVQHDVGETRTSQVTSSLQSCRLADVRPSVVTPLLLDSTFAACRCHRPGGLPMARRASLAVTALTFAARRSVRPRPRRHRRNRCQATALVRRHLVISRPHCRTAHSPQHRALAV